MQRFDETDAYIMSMPEHLRAKNGEEWLLLSMVFIGRFCDSALSMELLPKDREKEMVDVLCRTARHWIDNELFRFRQSPKDTP